MKTMTLSIAKKVGRILDQNSKTVKGFVNIVNNEISINGTKSEFFLSAFGALYSETECIVKTSGLKETKQEKTNRLIKNGLDLVKQLSEKQKKESGIFKVLSDKENLFVLLRNNLPCIYVDNKQLFAKVAKVAYNKATLNEEQITKFENSDNYKEISCLQKTGAKVELFVKSDYLDIFDQKGTLTNETIKSRTKTGNEIGDNRKYWFDKNQNVCCLVPFDCCNWSILLPVLIYGYKVKKMQESEKKAAAAKAAAAEQKQINSFNILLNSINQLSEKVEKTEKEKRGKFAKRAAAAAAKADNFQTANEQQKQQLKFAVTKLSELLK